MRKRLSFFQFFSIKIFNLQRIFKEDYIKKMRTKLKLFIVFYSKINNYIKNINILFK